MGEIEMRGESNGYARVGLLGNPSDVYYGKTISFSVANFCSTVTLGPSDEPLHDLRDHNFTPSYAINIPRQFVLNLVVGILLYRLMFGGDALGDLNLKMVEVARKVGAASKFTQKEGFVILPIEPFPSRLNEIDLKTLQIK
ncbi:hypothetical protein JHK82_052037 [Glycine max]|nr:hypothetical protein JHK82_052037 [Glycine max]